LPINNILIRKMSNEVFRYTFAPTFEKTKRPKGVEEYNWTGMDDIVKKLNKVISERGMKAISVNELYRTPPSIDKSVYRYKKYPYIIAYLVKDRQNVQRDDDDAPHEDHDEVEVLEDE
jgi:hypothetical protein